MLRYKHIDRICVLFVVVALVLTTLFINGEALGLESAETDAPYKYKLLSDSTVHTIDIVADQKEWDAMLENAMAKEYIACTMVIDGETFKNVAVRPKGNTSLSQVASSDSDRYSLKVEFDHYDKNTTYHGLDKLALNNLIQDNTCLKDYLAYHMMNEMGIAAPYSSFTYITVNGEDFGLYLAVEGIEEALIQRSYGSAGGNLYKPDSMQMGGGGGFGQGAGGADLKYIDDDLDSYSVIWEGAVFDASDSDKARLVESLRKLAAGEDLESAVDVDAVLRYFVAHNFVLNFDSYTGNMLHNYYLYEKDGQISMIPWDYNLAFGSFGGMGARGGPGEQEGQQGQQGPTSQSATDLVNFPIDTPVSGATLEDRPLLGKLLEVPEYLDQYHQLFDQFISGYFESGTFAAEFDRVVELITPYVQKDPTAFTDYEKFQAGTQSLRELCLLRAQSIRGQLDGSIPATSEGQSADSSAFINADHVSVSDTGSMGMGGGPGGNRPGMPGGFTQEEEPVDYTQDLILLAVSLVALVFGFIFVRKFRA